MSPYLKPSFRYPALSKYHLDSGSIHRRSHGRLTMKLAKDGVDMFAGESKGEACVWCGAVDRDSPLPEQLARLSPAKKLAGAWHGHRDLQAPIGAGAGRPLSLLPATFPTPTWTSSSEASAHRVRFRTSCFLLCGVRLVA